VKVEKDGFKTAILEGVGVFVSQTATADAALETGSTSATVEVTSPSITLQTDEPNLGTVIQSTILEEVPTFIGGGRDRQIDSFLFLVPGVTGGALATVSTAASITKMSHVQRRSRRASRNAGIPDYLQPALRAGE